MGDMRAGAHLCCSLRSAGLCVVGQSQRTRQALRRSPRPLWGSPGHGGQVYTQQPGAASRPPCAASTCSAVGAGLGRRPPPRGLRKPGLGPRDQQLGVHQPGPHLVRRRRVRGWGPPVADGVGLLESVVPSSLPSPLCARPSPSPRRLSAQPTSPRARPAALPLHEALMERSPAQTAPGPGAGTHRLSSPTGQGWAPLQLQGPGSHPKGQPGAPQGQQASRGLRRPGKGPDRPRGQQLEEQEVPPKGPRQGWLWGWQWPWVPGPPRGPKPSEEPGP